MTSCNPSFVRLSALLLILIGGCTKTAEESPAQPAVDPRFESAAALLAHYNSITTREPVDIVAAFDLCYAENDFQRRYIGLARRMQPFAELDYLMFQRFGECFNPKSKAHSLAADQPATMSRSDEQRAEASFIDSDGDSKTLHLVRVGDRWWVSGFTFEYDPQTEKYKQDIDSLERLTDLFTSATPGVITRMKNGEFKSAAEVRKAFGEATWSAGKDHQTR